MATIKWNQWALERHPAGRRSRGLQQLLKSGQFQWQTIEMFQPRKAILPIFTGLPNEPDFGFSGTGFFVAKESFNYFVTANHVVQGQKAIAVSAPIETGQEAPGELIQSKFYPAKVLLADAETDLTILSIPNLSCSSPLMLGQDEILPFRQVCCYEYSRSQRTGGATYIHESTRIGNVVRYITDTVSPPLYAPRSLELSFPLLQGASGAPIFVDDGEWSVVGVAKSNALYELLPVQKTQVMDQVDGRPIREEVSYHLPQGVATNVKWLKELIARLPTPPLPPVGQ